MQVGACYIRVSTDEQLEFSPDAQMKALKEYAKKNNIDLSQQYTFIDEGISGKRADKRPAFINMITTAKLKPKPFDVILVHKFDRFARSREDSIVYKSLLKKEAGIKVISVTESIEDDKFSIILEAMLEAMAEYYSLNLADEVKKGMTEKATRGGLQTAPAFGYRAENNRLVIVPEEAEFVKYIFTKFASGEMGALKLAHYANELGIRSKRGGKFENRTIEYILNNPVYIGKIRWTPTGKTSRNYNNPNSIIADSDHEPIIDFNLWEKVQATIKERKKLYTKRQKHNFTEKSWLQGIIKCGNCGKALVASTKDYLQCSGYSKGICRQSQYIKTSIIENYVLEQLKNNFTTEIAIHITASEKKSDNEQQLLEESLNKLTLKKNRIKEAYENGIGTLAEYKESILKIEDERHKILNFLNNIEKPINIAEIQKNTFIKSESVYHFLTDSAISLEIKYRAVHFLIEKIIFDKSKNSLSIQYKY